MDEEISSTAEPVSPLLPCSPLSLPGADSFSSIDSKFHSYGRLLGPSYRRTMVSHVSSPGWSSSSNSYGRWSGDTDPSLIPSEIATSPVTPKSPALTGRFISERRTSIPVSRNDPSYKALSLSEKAQVELIRRGPKHHRFRLRSHLKQDNILEWLEGAECRPRFTPIAGTPHHDSLAPSDQG